MCEISVKYHTNEEFDKKLFVKTKEDAVKILRGFMQEDIELEEMTYGVILGPSLKVIGCINIGRGDLTSCVINSKKLISACLLCNGNAVIRDGNALLCTAFHPRFHLPFIEHASAAMNHQRIL